MKPFRIAVIATTVFVAGCTSDDYMRVDGLTPGAGNAIAANTAMQMVDPWQYGVQHTDLDVPADRNSYISQATADEAAAAQKPATTSGPSD